MFQRFVIYKKFNLLFPEASHQRCSIKKSFLKISQYSQENNCVGVFFNKVASLRLQHRCFPVNIAKFLRTTILKNICDSCFCISENPRFHLYPTLYSQIFTFQSRENHVLISQFFFLSQYKVTISIENIFEEKKWIHKN